MEIVFIVLGVIVAAGLSVLIYRAVRSYDGTEHHTYVTQKEGKDTKPIREPTILWNPSIKVLKKVDAPNLTFMTQRPSSSEYVEHSLVTRPSGQICLRIHTCTPRPFPAMTIDRHKVLVRAAVTFQLDVERIEVACQLYNFGSALAARVENLFDNEIGKYRDEELRANQTTIEEAVTKAMQAIEDQTGEAPMQGIPLGIHVYEASFAFDEVPPEALDPAAMDAPAAAGGGGPGIPRGVMWIHDQQLDRIADVFRDRDPVAAASLMRMLELQTRQNIVQLLTQSGAQVGISAKELGLANPAEPISREAFESFNGHKAVEVEVESVDNALPNGSRQKATAVTAEVVESS